MHGNLNRTNSGTRWGSIGLISGKLGGTPIQQTLGMTTGAVLFGS